VSAEIENFGDASILPSYDRSDVQNSEFGVVKETELGQDRIPSASNLLQEVGTQFPPEPCADAPKMDSETFAVLISSMLPSVSERLEILPEDSGSQDFHLEEISSFAVGENLVGGIEAFMTVADVAHPPEVGDLATATGRSGENEEVSIDAREKAAENFTASGEVARDDIERAMEGLEVVKDVIERAMDLEVVTDAAENLIASKKLAINAREWLMEARNLLQAVRDNPESEGAAGSLAAAASILATILKMLNLRDDPELEKPEWKGGLAHATLEASGPAYAERKKSQNRKEWDGYLKMLEDIQKKMAQVQKKSRKTAQSSPVNETHKGEFSEKKSSEKFAGTKPSKEKFTPKNLFLKSPAGKPSKKGNLGGKGFLKAANSLKSTDSSKSAKDGGRATSQKVQK
jgi:hypothetical protein